MKFYRDQKRKNIVAGSENQEELVTLKLGRTGRNNETGRKAQDGLEEERIRSEKTNQEIITISQKNTGDLKYGINIEDLRS